MPDTTPLAAMTVAKLADATRSPVSGWLRKPKRGPNRLDGRFNRAPRVRRRFLVVGLWHGQGSNQTVIRSRLLIVSSSASRSVIPRAMTASASS